MKTQDHITRKQSGESEKIASSDKSEFRTSEKASEDVSVLRAASEETTGKNIECLQGVDAPGNFSTALRIPRPAPSIKITEDLTLLLVPRLKFNFAIGCINGRPPPEPIVKQAVTFPFMNSFRLCNTPPIPDDDVQCRYLLPPKRSDADNPMVFVAEGYFFIRDPRLVKYKEVLVKFREILMQKVEPHEIKYNGAVYKVWLSVPASEDPNKMMASQINYPGPSQEPPTLVIKGLPSQWFAEKPNSSEPSKRLLRIFLESFGTVRDFDVIEDVVSVKYEDCYKALQSLCACSLRKEGVVETVDYIVMWKEHDLYRDTSCLVSRFTGTTQTPRTRNPKLSPHTFWPSNLRIRRAFKGRYQIKGFHKEEEKFSLKFQNS